MRIFLRLGRGLCPEGRSGLRLVAGPRAGGYQGALFRSLRRTKLLAIPFTPPGTFAFSRPVSASASGVKSYSSMLRLSGRSASHLAR
jgi:hypothetical protein